MLTMIRMDSLVLGSLHRTILSASNMEKKSPESQNYQADEVET